MTTTPPAIATESGGDGPRRQLRPPGRRARIGLAVLGLAVVAFTAAALIPGSHTQGPTQFGVQVTVPVTSSKDALNEHVSTVVGASVSAKQYGTADGARENQGVNTHGQLTSDLTPLPVAAFKEPISEYRVYAERWAHTFAAAAAKLRGDLVAGDRDAAKRDWQNAYFDFLHLGADYNLLPAGLTAQLAEIPSSPTERHFTGLHRIEKGLWTGQSLPSLVPVATSLVTATGTLTRILPTVPIDTLDYTLRSHEVLEDAARDLMSGADVPWSGAGVIATEGGVLATRELLRTLTPLLEGRDNSLVESENWLRELQAALISVKRSDGDWPTLNQLMRAQRERIDGMLQGTLSALEQVPGALETKSTAIAGFESIPKADVSR